MKERTGNLLITSAFLGCIAVLSVLSVGKTQRSFSEQENRYLQTKPEFTWKRLADGSFGTKYETYLSDQFPGRDTWIGIKVQAERAQMKEDTNGIYFGRQGYLIEKFDKEDIVTEQFQSNLNKLEAMVGIGEQKLGRGHVKVMLVPSASAVIKDKLPLFAAPYDQRHVEEELAERVGEEAVISMDSVFKGHETEDIYYRTDHHWTALGAYYGYTAWAEAMGMEPWPQEKFEIKTVSSGFLGTVYSKVHVKTAPDHIELYLPKDQVEYEVHYDGSSDAADGLYSYGYLDKKDKYSVYLDGNHALTEIVNKQVPEERKGTSLLIIKDSYAHSFAPLAINHYEKVYMMDLRYYNLPPSKFLEENPVTDMLFMYQIPGFATEASLNKLQ